MVDSKAALMVVLKVASMAVERAAMKVEKKADQMAVCSAASTAASLVEKKGN